MNYYYILPDGGIVNSMKEGCILMNISSETFRRLVKKNKILKIESKSADYEEIHLPSTLG